MLFFSPQFLMSGWANGYSYRCDIVDYSSSPQALRVKQKTNFLFFYWGGGLTHSSKIFPEAWLFDIIIIFLDGMDLLAVLLL